MANKGGRDNSSHSSITSSGAGFMLFGVRIGGPADANGGSGEPKMNKSQSLGNLEACNKPDLGGKPTSGYLSHGVVHKCSKSHARNNKGKPWTSEEHRLFVQGLAALGKGDWKGIAAKYVKTKSPAQVASHAQKYFIRMAAKAKEKERRRKSVFDDLQDSLTNMATAVASPPIPMATTRKPPLPPMLARHRGICNLHGGMIIPARATPVPPAPLAPLVKFSNQPYAHLPCTSQGHGGSFPFLAQPWLPGSSSLFKWQQQGLAQGGYMWSRQGTSGTS